MNFDKYSYKDGQKYLLDEKKLGRARKLQKAAIYFDKLFKGWVMALWLLLAVAFAAPLLFATEFIKIPNENTSIMYLIATLVFFFKMLIIFVGIALAALVAYLIMRKQYRANADKYDKAVEDELMKNATCELRDYYKMTYPLCQDNVITTKCFACSDENFVDHDICLYVHNRKLYMTADIKKGFLNCHDDKGRYIVDIDKLNVEDIDLSGKAALKLSAVAEDKEWNLTITARIKGDIIRLIDKENKSILREKGDFDTSDYIELMQGRYKHELWKDTSLFVQAKDIFPIELLFYKNIEDFDHHGVTIVRRRAKEKIKTDLEEVITLLQDGKRYLDIAKELAFDQYITTEFTEDLFASVDSDREFFISDCKRIIAWMDNTIHDFSKFSFCGE